MKLVASIIVRNEFGRFLPLAVEHLLSFCDELRVLDDNSDDGTYEYLVGSSITNPVFVRRNPGPTFLEMESDARNLLLEWTMEGKPDYVLSIDADEFVSDPFVLKECMQRRHPVYTLDMLEVWEANQTSLSIRKDGAWGPRLCPILWQAPARLTREWMIPDRKLACGREPERVRRTSFRKSGTSVLHFGWTSESDREARAQRYFEHDKGRFHRNAHLESILWPRERVVMSGMAWPPGVEPLRDRLLERVRPTHQV